MVLIQFYWAAVVRFNQITGGQVLPVIFRLEFADKLSEKDFIISVDPQADFLPRNAFKRVSPRTRLRGYFDGRGQEGVEERMAVYGAGGEFGVELYADKPGVIGNFNYFNELSVRGCP